MFEEALLTPQKLEIVKGVFVKDKTGHKFFILMVMVLVDYY